MQRHLHAAKVEHFTILDRMNDGTRIQPGPQYVFTARDRQVLARPGAGMIRMGMSDDGLGNSLAGINKELTSFAKQSGRGEF